MLDEIEQGKEWEKFAWVDCSQHEMVIGGMVIGLLVTCNLSGDWRYQITRSHLKNGSGDEKIG